MDSDNEQACRCLIPAKKVKKTDWKRCLICQLYTRESVSCATSAGIIRFQDALRKRNDDVAQRLASGDLLPTGIIWHRNCNAKYTSSHNLSFVNKRSSKTSYTTKTTTEESEESKLIHTTRSASSGMDWTKCMFCQKITHKKTKKLFTVSTFSVCDTILHTTEARNDLEMLKNIRNVDLIAAEAKYHEVCKAQYTGKRNVSSTSFQESADGTIYAEAFDKLVQEIRPGIVAGKAYTMTFLSSRYKVLLEQHNISVDNYRSQRLKNRLQNHFRSSVVFLQQPNPSKPELVFSRDISLHDVINASSTCSPGKDHSCSQEESRSVTPNIPSTKHTLYHTSQIIKADIKDCDGINTSPLNINDLTIEKIKEMVPQSLYWLLRWLINPGDSNIL